MSDLISLRFIKPMSPYGVGDEAGFTLKRSDNIVRLGRAVYVTPPPGCDELGKPIKKEPVVKDKKASKAKTAPKKEPTDGLKSRRSGRLGTVKK